MFGRDKNKKEDDVLPMAVAPAPASAPAAAPAVPDRSPGDSMLGPSLTLKGEVAFEDGLTIEGGVEGRVTGQGALTIGAGGRVLGDVLAASILIRGRVQGNITAADRLELAATAIVVGDIHAARLVVADGARVLGKVEIGADSLSMPSSRSEGKSSARSEDALEKVF